MDKVLKQRLVGASILIALAVIFVPMLFDSDDGDGEREMDLNLPDAPAEDLEVRRLPLGDQQAPAHAAGKLAGQRVAQILLPRWRAIAPVVAQRIDMVGIRHRHPEPRVIALAGGGRIADALRGQRRAPVGEDGLQPFRPALLCPDMQDDPHQVTPCRLRLARPHHGMSMPRWPASRALASSRRMSSSR